VAGDNFTTPTRRSQAPLSRAKSIAVGTVDFSEIVRGAGMP
jgi:hypothetical protein